MSKYASVLPYGKDSAGNVYLLLGQERHAPGYASSDRWSDFGGMSEADETLRAAAARECYEESMGLFGTQSELERVLNEQLSFSATGPSGGRHYLLRVPLNDDVVQHFSRFYHYARCSAALHSLTLPHNDSGMFEKQAIRWVPLRAVADVERTGQLPLRYWFRKTLFEQIENPRSVLYRL